MANPHLHSLELNSILEDDNPPQPPLSTEQSERETTSEDGIVSLDLSQI